MTAGAAAVARPNPVWLTGLLGVVVALAIGGAVVASQAFTRAVGHASGDTIFTSFGSIVVTDFAKLDGLTSADLNGMTHGVGGLVGAGQVEIRVRLRVVNSSDHAVRLDAGEFRLSVPSAKDPLAPATTTVEPITLLPGSNVDATLAFVTTPTDGAATLTFTAPGETTSIQVGQLEAGSPRPDAGHTH